MSRNQRLALVAAAVAVLVVAFIVAKGGSDDKKTASSTATTVVTEPATPSSTGTQTTAETAPSATTTNPTTVAADADPVLKTVVVGADGKAQGGIQTLTFAKGGVIAFRVRSAIADEIHFHGYDVMKDVTAGGTVTFNVPAKFDGRFVVELEGRGQQIASVEVTP